ncbi:MAG: histidinol-phosphatase [Bacteroidales bacterium]|nr:histidinol-phosphatase [Bacteroidales bacterium]
MTGQNLHTHTLYSDGKASMRQVVETAVAQNMHTLGISDHAPVSFDNAFSIKPDQLQDYCRELRFLQKEYSHLLHLFLALEMDFIPGISQPFSGLKDQCGLDYVIGSVHLVGSNHPENLWFTDGPVRDTFDEGLATFFGNDIRKAVGAFFRQTNQMIEQEVFDVIGHFDKIKMHNQNRFFTEDEAWYRDMVMETLQLIREKNLIVEINTRGVYKKRSDSFFPSGWILQKMNSMHVPVLISSDAHQAEELQMLFPEANDALKSAGYAEQMHFSDKGWELRPI